MVSLSSYHQAVILRLPIGCQGQLTEGQGKTSWLLWYCESMFSFSPWEKIILVVDSISFHFLKPGSYLQINVVSFYCEEHNSYSMDFP